MIIRAITKSNDGYKIYFDTGKVLILECYDDSYQGTSYWGSYWGINDLDIENGKILGDIIINYYDLPPMIKSHVEWLMSENDSG